MGSFRDVRSPDRDECCVRSGGEDRLEATGQLDAERESDSRFAPVLIREMNLVAVGQIDEHERWLSAAASGYEVEVDRRRLELKGLLGCSHGRCSRKIGQRGVVAPADALDWGCGD